MCSKYFLLLLGIVCFFPPKTQAFESLFPVGESSLTVPYPSVISFDSLIVGLTAKVEQKAVLSTVEILAQQPAVLFLAFSEDGKRVSLPDIEALALLLRPIDFVRCQTDNVTVTCTAYFSEVRNKAGKNNKAADSQELEGKPFLTKSFLKEWVQLLSADVGRVDRYEALVRKKEHLLTEFNDMVFLLEKKKDLHEARARLEMAVKELHALAKYEKLLTLYGAKGWTTPDKAYYQLAQILETEFNSAIILAAFAEAAIQVSLPERADAAIKSAIVKESDAFAYFYDIQGMVYLQQNFPVLASDAFSKAASLNPHRPLYRIHKGSALLVQGEKNEACSEFYASCALGDCSGFEWATSSGQCEEN